MRIRRSGSGLLLGVASLSICSGAAAAPVFAPDGASGDHFGYSVAISGATAIVGSPGDDTQGLLSGSAYVFTLSSNTWVLQAKLTPSDGASQTSFGQAVSISGDTAVVGAPYAAVSGTPAGAAYVFTRTGSTWSQQAKLVASDPVAFDFFGSTVSVSGNTVAAGAPYADIFGADSGATYVFARSGSSWSQSAKVFPADGRSGDLFGSSVSLDASSLAVGAPNDDDSAVASGSAYVFAKSGSAWLFAQKLRPSDGQNGDLFGNAVALSVNDLLIGAPENDGLAVASGAAYHFARNAGLWSFNQKLTAADAAAGDFFGAAVALSGNRALVGAFLDDGIEIDSGASYVFARNSTTWSQARKDVSTSAGPNDNLGASVAIDGTNALLGADQDDDLGADSGSVVYLNLNPSAVAAVPALGDETLSLALVLLLLAAGMGRAALLRDTRTPQTRHA
jgi:FG-GAP repeat